MLGAYRPLNYQAFVYSRLSSQTEKITHFALDDIYFLRMFSSAMSIRVPIRVSSMASFKKIGLLALRYVRTARFFARTCFFDTCLCRIRVSRRLLLDRISAASSWCLSLYVDAFVRFSVRFVLFVVRYCASVYITCFLRVC